MFGGVCFMLNGHMCCGVTRDLLVLRLGEEGAADAFRRPHTREMDFTGRPMKAMVYVEPAGTATEAKLGAWIEKAARFVNGLPAR